VSPKSKTKEVSSPNPIILDLLPLNHVLGLPGDELTFSLQNRELIQLVQKSHQQKKQLITTLQQSFNLDQKISIFGVVAEVIEIDPNEQQRLRFKLKFKQRAELTKITKKGKDYEAELKFAPKSQNIPKEEWQAFQDEVDQILKQLKVQINGNFSSTFKPEELDQWSAKLARALEFKLDDRVKLLEGWAIKKRIQTVMDLLNRYQKISGLRKQIRKKANDKIQKLNRDSLLEEEKKAIEFELNKGKRPTPPELQYLKDKIDVFIEPEEVKKVIDHEYEKLVRIGTGSPGASVIQDYLEILLDLPWNEQKQINPDWDRVEKGLRDSHFGLEKVKERILRYLAVTLLSKKPMGNLLCLVGPPGVGKTSFAKAIAEALELPFIKKSLGGVRDESEIRGHRRTYVGAMPGRIIQGLRKAGCSNPVFLLDEVDKLGRDHRGDPSDALLEVLDPEENHQFSDHYIELDFDLSKVFWVLTANREENIPAPLRDRLDIIRFSGYTHHEKMNIAKNYLTQKSMDKLGLEDFKFELKDPVIDKIIRHYTREPGVRELSRKISNLAQQLALDQVRSSRKKTKWSPPQKLLKQVFGPPLYQKPNWTKRQWTPGVMAGLAYTTFGGTVMRMECSRHEGKGQLKLTGKLGEVMQESAHTAFSFLKNNCSKLELDPADFKDFNYHIHIPAGATPKEGPSAGIALGLLLYSCISEKSCRPFWALTGEITLHGKAMAIGGVKEKILAAQQESFEGVMLPKSNQPQIEDLESEAWISLEVRYIDSFWDALRWLFPN
jgi:ATP-dependent Lon protease